MKRVRVETRVGSQPSIAAYNQLAVADSKERGESHCRADPDLLAVYTDFGISRATQHEIEVAKRFGHPIEYRSIL